jgi:predicted cupin superfamily sugar epimerase
VTRPPTAVRLRLEPHPEGGWYRRTWTSPAAVGDRPEVLVSCVVSPGFRWSGFELG